MPLGHHRGADRAALPGPSLRAGFSLLELLVVIAVIMLLIGMVIPAVALVSQSANKARTRGLVDRVLQAVRVYQAEERRHRFPPALADRTLRYERSGAVPAGQICTLNLLAAVGFAVHGEDLGDDAGNRPFLADAWGQPLLYQVDEAGDGTAHRPLDAAGQEVRVPADAADLNPRGVQPYAYAWSYGRPASGHDLRANAAHWLYRGESP